jgi:hypothetical protein
MKNEQVKGMAGSLLFHGGVAILLLFWTIAEPTKEPEFVEVSWSSSSAPARVSSGVSGGSPGRLAVSPGEPSAASTPVKLPERLTPHDNEVLPTPPREKLEVRETPGGKRQAGQPALRRDAPQSIGRREGSVVPGAGSSASEKPGEGLEAGPGTSAGSGVSMAMEWAGGGTRRKLSGALPVYPPGETTEAQIKIEALVTPEGHVRMVRPVQRASARLEEAAMKEVRLWTFEPLSPLLPQRDQRCLITFNFRLR